MANSKHQKSQFRIWVEYLPFLAVYKILHILPPRWSMKIGQWLFDGFYVLDARHRTRTVQHLLHAGVAHTPGEARAFAHKTYREFGKLFAEIIDMDRCYDPKKVRLVGDPEAIAYCFDHARTPRNAIVATAHYGNWEVAGTAFADQAGIPMVSIMRPFGNPKIGELILAHRRSGVHTVVDKAMGIRPILRALNEGKNIAILIDQHASSSEGVETVFFGQPCRTHKTPALLHLKTGIPIVPELTRRCGDDFEFEIVVGPLIRHTPTGDKERDIREITQQCTTALEKLISERPEQWMWTHRRWLNLNRKH